MSTLLNIAAQVLRNCRRLASNTSKHSDIVWTRKSKSRALQPHGNSEIISSGFHKYKIYMDVPEGVFHGTVDRFNGVIIDSDGEFDEKVNFADKLQNSLRYWVEQGRRCIWFKVRTEHSISVPALTANGFDFHHAKQGYVMLYKWLPTTEEANIPSYSHTMLGVGGLVINDKNEILAVSDRYALIPNSWKLPGGYVEPNEDLVDAAIREVEEETSVETSFDSVVAVRHAHGGSFACSDMYFVIALKPKTSNLSPCPREISKVQWMPVAEYLCHPNVHETNRQFVRTFLNNRENGIKFNCISAIHQVLNRRYNLYFIEKEENTNI